MKTRKIEPLHQDRRYQDVHAWEVALRERLDALKAEALRPQRPPQDAWVAQLLRDPGAPLATVIPPPDYSGQISAVQAAISATEQEAQRLRITLSNEVMSRLRPARAERVAKLAELFQSAMKLIDEDYAACREATEAGYEAPSAICGFGDRDAVERIVQRMRENTGHA